MEANRNEVERETKVQMSRCSSGSYKILGIQRVKDELKDRKEWKKKCRDGKNTQTKTNLKNRNTQIQKSLDNSNTVAVYIFEAIYRRGPHKQNLAVSVSSVSLNFQSHKVSIWFVEVVTTFTDMCTCVMVIATITSY